MDLLRLIGGGRRAPAAGFSLALLALAAAGAFGPTAPPGHPTSPVGPAPARAQLLSPGPLTSDHADLEGDDNCSRCHSSGRGLSTRACLDCHRDLRARIRAGKGLHGRTYRGRDCGGCHVEHLGRNAPLVRWPGGRMASFDHADAGWRLEGAHREVDCGDCHDQRNRRGHRTFLGLDDACASCHRDPHDGRFGRDCADCHGQAAFDRGLDLDGFDHRKARFPLRGAHARVECAGCHGTPATYRSLDFGTCASCHEDPHAGRLGGDCASCHVETRWDEVDGILRRHPGIPLRNGHRGVACARCHDRGNTRAPSAGSACVSCHRPVHEADFGRNCRRCHGSIRWTGIPDAIGRRAHGATPFPLEGRHEAVACEACHAPSEPPDARYRQLAFERCASCHADPHGGALVPLSPGGDCVGCHDVRGFAPSEFGPAEHTATGFALEGRHFAVPCAACHGAERPRVDFTVARQDCADCHENPHGDQFAAEMADGGCASCHAPTGWDRPRIDHDTWPLTGAHADAACASCHRASAEDRRAGRGASFRGVPRACAGCHADPHAGQFRLTEPVRDCETCHRTDRFALPDFDHDATVGWALQGRHAQTACADCHPTARLRNGVEAVRWRLGYRACSDCHANPHREVRGEEGG